MKRLKMLQDETSDSEEIDAGTILVILVGVVFGCYLFFLWGHFIRNCLSPTELTSLGEVPAKEKVVRPATVRKVVEEEEAAKASDETEVTEVPADETAASPEVQLKQFASNSTVVIVPEKHEREKLAMEAQL